MVLAVEREAGGRRKDAVEFEEALDRAGLGVYNVGLLVVCCLLILAMYLDIFGFSIALPAAACDLRLSAEQQATLSSAPLLGVMCMSYAWGLAADTLGRRRTLLGAMTAGFLFNLAGSMVSSFIALCVLKFISAAFTASANAAGFVLVGEMTPRAQRNRFLFLMASVTMYCHLFISVCALPILPLGFRVPLAWLGAEYRPWRLLLQLLSVPGGAGAAALCCFAESPKFLLSRGRHDEALSTLRGIYSANTGRSGDTYDVRNVKALYLEETARKADPGSSLLRKVWDQTAPLFTPPLLKHSLIVYYVLLTAYMTSTGYSMWVPTLTNKYFDGGDHAGQTFCDVVSGVDVSDTAGNTTIEQDCDNVVKPMTLYSVMLYSGVSGTLNMLLSFAVGALGRKRITLGIFCACALCGALLDLARTPALSIALFYCFLYVCLVLAAINSYIVELFPTHLRGMATCVSVVVARGSGTISVQLIASLLQAHCRVTVYSFVALVASGGAVALLLPSDTKPRARKEVAA